MANVLKASKFIQLPKPLQIKLVRSSHVIPINDKFIPYFGSREKIILLYGSYGNGKSKFVAQDLVEKCRTDKYLNVFTVVRFTMK
jgi:phage terminase large subunit